jgi:hypothetical protein
MGTNIEMSVPGYIAFRAPQQHDHARHTAISWRRGILQFLQNPVWCRVNTEKVVRKNSE